MRNFTLRIRGTKLFLLSFVLFMGGLSMYGQQGCPTTANTDQNQTFCYLQTVGEIETDGTTVYRTETSTNPIPSDELLENAATYYIGNADGDCSTRIAVNITVNSAPAPVSGYGTTFSPTLGSSSDSFDVDDLIATLVDDNPGMNLVVFADQYDTNTLPGNTTLIAENPYWVGQTGNACPSERLAIRYDPIVAEAPTGEAQQTFCPEATVADLVAQGTSENTQAIRWYSTATSNPALGDDVILVDGETYYATQIINNVDSPLPPTESEDRFEVTVTVFEPVNAGDDASTVVCSNDSTLDLFTLLSGDADTDGAFTLDGTDLNGQFDPANYPAGEYSVTYSVADDCTTDEATFTITVTAQPDAPVIGDQEFCETDNATVADLGTDTNIAIYDDASLSNELAPSTALVDGIYFAVASDGPCTSEASEFEVAISEVPDAPVIANQTFCETDNATVADLGTGDSISIYDDASLTTELAPATALTTGTYYAVATNGSCVSDDTEFEVTITPAVSPKAGDDASFDVCINETIELTDYLSSDALTTGTFSGNGVSGTQFSASTAGDYTITYNVNSTNSCVTNGSDSATFTITVNNPADANAGEDMAFDACVNESIDLVAYLSDNAITSGEFTGDGVTEGMFMATTAGTYTVTYTVDENDTCVNAGTSDSATFTITVNNPADANAGEDMAFDACVNESIDLVAYLSDNAITSGEFTGDGVTEGMFMATTAGTYTVTYTVDENDTCVNAGTSDSATFTITVNNPADANAGEDMAFNACVNESIDLVAYLSDNAITSGEFTGDGVTEGMFMATTAGTYTVTYTVDENDTCVNAGTSDSATFTITVNNPADANAGEDMAFDACVNESIDLVAYLSDNAITSGEFTGDGVTEGMFMATTAGTYTVTYTVDENDTCVNAGTSDSATFTITVNNPADANAGEDMAFDACVNESIDLVAYLSDNAITTGEFTGDGVTEGMFMATTAGTYTVTYTVDENDTCVNAGTSDSATFTITVNNPADANAGEDMAFDACVNESIDLVAYLSDNAITSGEFTGDGVTEGMFMATTAGTYTVTYTVDENDTCVNAGTSDSATFTITVNNPADANAGEDMAFNACVNESIDLVAYLSDNAITSGEFTGDGVTEGMFMAITAGTYTVTYTVDENDTCVNAGTSDSATFTITVNATANAGDDATENVCVADTPIDLSIFLNGADDNGVFSLDGNDRDNSNFDISTTGTYVFTYTVTNNCGTDASTLTITVNEVPDAPTPNATDLSFCAVDGATVGDINVPGTNVAYYADETTEDALDATEVLTSGTYYATQTNASGCESERVAINVTVEDPQAPTIPAIEICEYDDRFNRTTLQDITEAINSDNVITWYDSADSDNALSNNTVLVDGTTYYASASNNATGCESSTRATYVVDFGDCETPFQEGISPNGDQLNDTFDLQYLKLDYPNYEVEIYNRWGRMVYKGNSSTQPWDGTSSESSIGDDVLPNGVYFYVIEFNDGSTPAKQGKIYLSR
ncbi:gliding motility-associated C-terminal domain-containing protein [Zunongwangia sp. HGR-M22]|uniref:gliding motility-associated C-terminal domain-containing protein n=1 Tax=Zunongwangia sp. HGR-M22 TaxID=3015168 RepID=UPI0022DE82EF|nr:gliding motility-associated C-terminal domain-containing protein [Zunongwangia sp. HGR-M22]WBL26166.1 gliding motility-associated C-terminal domain-containing protein [Zunongwangia sp. HGR-M22]